MILSQVYVTPYDENNQPMGDVDGLIHINNKRTGVVFSGGSFDSQNKRFMLISIVEKAIDMAKFQ